MNKTNTRFTVKCVHFRKRDNKFVDQKWLFDLKSQNTVKKYLC